MRQKANLQHILGWTERVAAFDGAVLCGMSRSSASRHFDFALNILMMLATRIPECVIELPKDDHSAQILANRASEYIGRNNSFIGMIDGTVIDCERPGDNVWQRHMYNGMDSKHAIKNCFVFLFDGTVACCALNFAGTCHDAKLCRFMDCDVSIWMENLCLLEIAKRTLLRSVLLYQETNLEFLNQYQLSIRDFV